VGGSCFIKKGEHLKSKGQFHAKKHAHINEGKKGEEKRGGLL